MIKIQSLATVILGLTTVAIMGCSDSKKDPVSSTDFTTKAIVADFVTLADGKTVNFKATFSNDDDNIELTDGDIVTVENGPTEVGLVAKKNSNGTYSYENNVPATQDLGLINYNFSRVELEDAELSPINLPDFFLINSPASSTTVNNPMTISWDDTGDNTDTIEFYFTYDCRNQAGDFISSSWKLEVNETGQHDFDFDDAPKTSGMSSCTVNVLVTRSATGNVADQFKGGSNTSKQQRSLTGITLNL